MLLDFTKVFSSPGGTGPASQSILRGPVLQFPTMLVASAVNLVQFVSVFSVLGGWDKARTQNVKFK